MRKQWRRLEKSMREATSPQPSSLSTSSGRTIGYGKIFETEKVLLLQRAVCLTYQESLQSTNHSGFEFNTFLYIYFPLLIVLDNIYSIPYRNYAARH